MNRPEPKEGHWTDFAQKMREAGVAHAAIRAFEHSYSKSVAGDSGMMPEQSIQPVEQLPRLEDLKESDMPPGELLRATVVIKLNGGLGTSMGLERAKSLLTVKQGLTFLDLIARQVIHLRKQDRVPLRFMLMNSFSTSADTREFLRKYAELGDPAELELMQSQAPKVDPGSLRPARWPANPQLEWCPPGHGDIYPSLLGSGTLDNLLNAGIQYAFVSNSDNLGASLDLALLRYIAESGKSFLMEVAERTLSDRKGGHLAKDGDRYVLRESAQCPKADLEAFQDIHRHRFFNTNNLWVRLDHLRDLLDANGGYVPLPIIRNKKNIDPRDKHTPEVIQLETAMGAAIQCFENAGAIVVPRTRFAPVKTTSDLLALRSDAYVMTDDWRVVLNPEGVGHPPTLELDSNHYKLVDQLEEKLARGVPSLRRCDALAVKGPVAFNAGNIFLGKVSLKNPAGKILELPPGDYKDQVVTLPQGSH